MADVPQINGQMVSWAELSLVLELHGGQSIRTKDFAAVDYSDTLEGAKVPGTGPKHVGTTVGVYNAEASITMYRAAFGVLQAALASLANGRAGLAKFDLTVSYEPLVDQSDPALGGTGQIITDVLRGCRLAGRSVSNAPGSDATQVQSALMIDELIMAGVRMV